jgi:microcystin-dependent protein
MRGCRRWKRIWGDNRLADTLTPNYQWVKPEVGGSPTTWGTKVNADLDLIDAQVHSNQMAGSNVGDVKMFAGATPPANWLICDGSARSTATYPALFNVIGYMFGGSGGSFNLPNTGGRFPIGAGGGYTLGGYGGEATHVLSTAEMPTHNHGVSDPTHAHAVADPGHNHPVSDPGHSHGVSDPGHFHAINATPGTGGIGSLSTMQAVGTEATQSAATGVSIVPAATNFSVSAAAAGIVIDGAATGITTQNAGGGGAHNNLPPFVCVNFIIRYQ